MATELAKAYVQILPSARGLQGALQSELGGEMDTAGKSAGGRLSGAIKKVLAAAGIGKAISATLNEGGALQQSMGGIETLFKDSADTVKAYAARAYETAGLSANAYMEMVTGFSASLLQGMGGDTAAAAEIADIAMQDMADNANKMGTDMQSIQNAYQGFAKNNYTMLDNLKLGYGGTQAEMQRLLADAEKIHLKTTGEATHYDINNLADVYQAIHEIQVELDITGTTANEAATTLTGSTAAMKAAFQNLLGDLSLGQDVGPSLQALGQTVSTFLTGNLLPMLGNILTGLPAVLSGALTQGLPQILSQAATFIGQFGAGMLAALPQLLQSAQALLLGLSAEFTANLPQFLQQGTDLLIQLVQGISDALPQLVEMTLTVLANMVDTLVANLPLILQNGTRLLLELVQGIRNALPKVIAIAGKTIVSMVKGLVDNLPQIIAAGFEMIVSLISGIGDALPDLISAAFGLVDDVWGVITNTDWLSLGKDIIRGLINGIGSMAGALWEAAKQAAKSALDGIKSFLGIQSPSKVMRDQVGRFIPEGIAVGIAQHTGAVSQAMRALADETTGTLQTQVVADVTAKGSATLQGYAGTGADGVRNENVFHIHIEGARYTDERTLAQAITQEMQFMLERRSAVFGTA